MCYNSPKLDGNKESEAKDNEDSIAIDQKFGHRPIAIGIPEYQLKTPNHSKRKEKKAEARLDFHHTCAPLSKVELNRSSRYKMSP